MNLYLGHLNSPVGRLKIVVGDAALVAVLWEDDDPRRVRLTDLMESHHHPILLRARDELNEYFSGHLTEFTLPLDPHGTSFQKQVWQALLSIPFGETRTYGQVASQLRRPTASRAVGAANGRNPISIVMPCHRVIGATGKLTGFAGGLKAKAFLLDLERRRLGAETGTVKA
jgi:methylated-DNA-[protein]-cysteine S-methyltransferase